MALAHKDYTVGWICPLFIEQAAAAAMLDENHPDLPKPKTDPNTYTLGKIGKHNVVIAGLPQGKPGIGSAAVTTASMVSTFPSIRSVLLVGIGGGIPSKVKLGDVVVSTPGDSYPGVIQWDMGKREANGAFKPVGSLNNPPISIRTALAKLRVRYETDQSKIPQYLKELGIKKPKMAAKYLKGDHLKDVPFQWNYNHVARPTQDEDKDSENEEDDEDAGSDACQWCDKTKVIKRKITTESRDMIVHFGLIASGNQVIKDGAFRRQLNKDLGGQVLCVEMEAAGLVDEFPCITIRGIADYADTHKNDSWQCHAAAAAAAFAKELLDCLIPSEVDGEKPVVAVMQKQIYSIAEDVTIVKSELGEQKEHTILDWLSRDYGHEQSEFNRIRQPGTGCWFIEAAEFRSWVDETQTLFCPGTPGAGKTILSSLVVDHLRASFKKDLNVCVLYIYCNYQMKAEQTIENLLQSFLRQLCQNQPSIPEKVREIYDDHRRTGIRPSLEQISENMLLLGSLYSKIYIVADALDECECWEQFLDQIFNFQAATQAKLLATSRFIPEILKKFERCQTLSISAREDDIRKFIRNDLNCLSKIVGDNSELLQYIENRIIATVDGMFLLAKLRINLLKGTTTLKEIEKALEESPIVSAVDNYSNHRIAYDDAYAKTIQAIKSQVYFSRICAEKALAWVIFARRPLHISELRDALAVEPGTTELDPKNLSQMNLVLNICRGLITVDEGSGMVRLVHYTAQEYLQHISCWFPQALNYIAETCIVYLSYSTFEAAKKNSFRARLKSNPVYGYMVRNWGAHTRTSLLDGQRLVLDFLKSESKMLLCSDIIVDPQYGRYDESPSKGMAGVHIAAYFGLVFSLKALLATGTDIESKDTSGRTPLWWAGQQGQVGALDILLESGGDLNVKDGQRGQSILSWLAENGRTAMVEHLLGKAADMEARDNQGRTPLSLAAKNGHILILGLLLDRGADLEAKDIDLRTALWHATQSQHVEAVAYLADRGANIDAKINDGFTPLLWAANNGYSNILEVLLNKGANIEAREETWGQTPLCLGIRSGCTAVVNALIMKRADINARDDRWGQTPVFWAIESGNVSIIKILVTNGANLEIDDYKGQTPLLITVSDENIPMVEFLIQNGANPNAADCKGQTPLLVALRNENTSIVELLIQNGANPNATDCEGLTPLLVAVRNGNVEIAGSLVKNGAKVNIQTGEGHIFLSWAIRTQNPTLIGALEYEGASIRPEDYQTQLWWAMEHKYDSAVQMIIENNIDLEVERCIGVGRKLTPLLWALTINHPALVKILVDGGANINAKNDIGETPLMQLVALHKFESTTEDALQMVKLLLDLGADVQVRDRRAQTVLHHAVIHDLHGRSMVTLILKTGANLEAENENGRTALSLAAGSASCDTMLVLLEHGANVRAVDKKGRTPLSWAAESGSQVKTYALLKLWSQSRN